MRKVIELKDLKVSFKNKRNIINIIRGVDLDLYESQIIGIVGESGSGKSVTSKTLLNVNKDAITTIESLKILENEFTSFKSIKWKTIRGKKIAYIPQNPHTSLNPSRKIKKQILDVMEENNKSIKTNEERMKKIVEMLKQFHIKDIDRILNSYPHELSGGLKQRVIIAISILTGSQIIIADEPTTALDATVQSSVLNLLKSVIVKEKLSLIFISHNIGVVAKLCDYIYVMYAGRIVERAPKKSLFIDPIHPYTWALISSIPEGQNKDKDILYTIPGNPVDMTNLPQGDPFASRNKYAIALDFQKEPPLFEYKKNHWAATWMLHPSYPKFKKPKELLKRINQFKKVLK
ncbi:MAG: ABC transporter ATP-binding protein [Mycoplasmatales bacterium]|nr:ABC transporter ATP-binding protein [Mycoplasmatales bacterium]